MEDTGAGLSDRETESIDQNLTIPSEKEDEIVFAETPSDKIYKFGLTLEEVFNMSLEDYKKGIY